ncbi:MAG: alkaline phosphatase family protein [Thermoanaerobaculaceae bacterium]|nr:alkaline phosphatase family protein [Thermoanaerobaculaceae bacterium]MDI9622159.1 alkaline phosphatase family protein [Acidobacteriota bacterium]NLH10058.1 hypothetical protein [Holophagae bacterium]HPW54882.1 alkaline phosphatase family protein [Thermoanaerobaculaceae bacterium]
MRARITTALITLLASVSVVAAGEHKVVLVSWDAAADWVVDRLLSEGRLPAVARMAREGVQAEHMLAAFPSKTAVGHAAIFTGCWGDRNGVAGNAVPPLPRSQHRVDETSSGFFASALRAEPLWVSAAKAGRRVVALSATQLHPVETHMATLRTAGVSADRLVAFSGFEHALAAPRVLGAETLRRPAARWTGVPPHRGRTRELAFDVAGTPFFALLFDDPADPVVGFDTVLVRQGSRHHRGVAQDVLKPASARTDTVHWSRTFRIEADDLVGVVRFRLFSLDPSGVRLDLYQRSVNGLEGTPERAETERYLEASGGFHDDAFGVYRRGMLGPPLWEGGDGEAERRLIEIVRLDTEGLKRGTRYALAHWQPDLLLHYTPLTDSAGHVWMGVLDPTSSRHDPALAAKLWPYYAQVFTLADDWLGDILDQVPAGTAVVLVSDHGMEGSTHVFHPNAVLENAGLLARTRTGELDVARTLVVSPPTADFHLVVNGPGWQLGGPETTDYPSLLARATRALLSTVDPGTGQPVVRAVFTASDLPGMGIGGPTGGDLYFDVAPGYYPSSQLDDRPIVEIPSPIGWGTHGFFPHRRTMHAILYLWGAGVETGKVIGPVQQVDVFPTVARLLAVPAPPTVIGHVLGDALVP